MSLLPFRPYPGFQWVLLALCVFFSLIKPEFALITAIWFAFAYHTIFNRISIKLSGKKFVIPSRHTKKEEIHLVGSLLLIPYFAAVTGSYFLLFEFALYVNGTG